MINTEKLGLKKLKLEQGVRLMFTNGQLALDDSHLDMLPEELIVTDIKTAQRNYPALFEKVKFTPGAVTGLFLYLPKNLKFFDLLQLIFSGDKGAELNHFFYLESGAELNLVEKYRLSEAAHQIEHFIFIEANARFNYYKLQEEALTVKHVNNFRVEQKRDSHFNSMIVSLGSKSAHDSMQIKLLEPNAHCELKAIAYGKDKQCIKNQVEVEHLSPHCSSKQLYKNMATDQAQLAFEGRIKVHAGAQKTMAEQLNQNLLLSPKAEIDARPELEIYADDVKCSHGATIGQLDPEALFYLRSRGLSLAEAQELLSSAFALSVLDGLNDNNVASFLKIKLMSHLSALPTRENLNAN